MKSIVEEFYRIARFGTVGLLATAVHFTVALAVGGLGVTSSVFLMNTCGFLAAVVVSFLGHYHFTFSSSQGYTSTFPKFFRVALAAYAASSLCVFLTSYAHLSDLWRLVLAVLVIPIMSYLANKKLVF